MFVYIKELKILLPPFLLQVQLQPGQSAEDGQKIAEDLMEELGVESQHLVEGAYLDLLLAKQQQKS